MTVQDVSRYLHVSHIFRAQDQWLREIGNHPLDHAPEFRETTGYYEFICHTCRRVYDLRNEDTSAEIKAEVQKNPQTFIPRVQRAYRDKNFSTLWDRLIREDSLIG